MKIKRMFLIICLIAISLICIYMMNNKFDPLARYQFTTKENREIIIENMSQDDINYIIQQKLKPEQFMNFIELDGFIAENILYYDSCFKSNATDYDYIVSFVNKYKSYMDLKTLPDLLKNYGYSQLEEFYNKAYPYVENVKLITNPNYLETVIGSNETLYKFEPTNLVAIDNSIIPFASKTNNEIIYIKEELIIPLQEMCLALEEENKVTAGGLILTSGYISYSEQIYLYEQALIKYGYDNFQLYEDYPGQSESQLGYTITFTLSQEESSNIKDSEQVKWLENNAYKYGFVQRYPSNMEKETGKYYQPLTYRFVGKENSSNTEFRLK